MKYEPKNWKNIAEEKDAEIQRLKAAMQKTIETLEKEHDVWYERYNVKKRNGFIDFYADGFADGINKAFLMVKEVLDNGGKTDVHKKNN